MSPDVYADYFARRVYDNEIVIVTRGDHIGAFFLKNQLSEVDTVEYHWFLRNDGVKNFRTNIENIEKGTGEAGDKNILFLPLVHLVPIEFGPFKFYWSINTHGAGWVYFNYYPEYKKELGNIEWCITNKIDIKKINILDPKCTWESITSAL